MSWNKKQVLGSHGGITKWMKVPSFNDTQLRRERSEVVRSCQTLCDPMNCSLPGSSVHGIYQARILEWVAICFSREFSQLREWTWVSCIAGGSFFPKDRSSWFPLGFWLSHLAVQPWTLEFPSQWWIRCWASCFLNSSSFSCLVYALGVFMLSSQFDTFLFKGQLWKGGHPRCERCLVITGCMFAKGGGEISYPWRQI